MPKVLVCASSLSHIRSFHLPYLRFFREQGFDVHLAVPEREKIDEVDTVHSIPMAKSLLSPKNLGAAMKMRAVFLSESYDAVFLHTALAALVARVGLILAGRPPGKVVYTIHGYLFREGRGFIRNMIYRLPERLLRGVTDVVIAMNGEDERAALTLVRRGGRVVKVPGMGVDGRRFSPGGEADRTAARARLSIPDGAFVLVYAAEFSKRKNHGELLHAMAEIVKTAPDALLLLCGSGKLRNEAEALTERLGLVDNVRFLGWQSRMEDVYAACDLAVSSSFSEGLPFNIAEAQLCALPTVASRVKGHTDLIEDGAAGFLYPSGDFAALAEKADQVIRSEDWGRSMGLAGRESAARFTLDRAFEANTKTYLNILNGDS